MPSKAVEYLLRAGDAARANYADQEAIRHYRRAREFLARLGDDRRSRETLFKIALVHHLAFDFAQAESAYDEAFACKVEPFEQPAPTERLVTALLRPNTLAPGLEYISETSALSAHLFRGLLIVDRDLNVMPSLAENFRVSSDGTTYMFQLRAGTCWSDGEPLTAHDFVYTWERARKRSTGTAFLLEDVERATALDDHTLEVVLREPRNYFPYILASPHAAPWPRHLCESLGEEWHAQLPLVSSGPFVLSEMTEERMLMIANPRWSGRRGNLREIEVELPRARQGGDRPVAIGWVGRALEPVRAGGRRRLARRFCARPGDRHDRLSRRAGAVRGRADAAGGGRGAQAGGKRAGQPEAGRPSGCGRRPAASRHARPRPPHHRAASTPRPCGRCWPRPVTPAGPAWPRCAC